METREVKRVVIAGGGTAGWLAAAALSHQLGKVLDITLIESDEIGTIGVGEATIPPIRVFHKLLQIDEQEFMRATAATFKLGISFENWGLKGDHYIHSFGRNGKPTWMCEFHNFWLRSLELGVQSELGDYCFELQAAKAGKFGISQQIDVNFAYHFDASQYAKFLRRFAEGFGIKRVEGKIKEVRQNATTGFIESLVLHSGVTIEGDLFIDCTGFRGLIIEQTLKTGYEDWSHWLPCDSAAAVQTELTGAAPPYTRSIAHDSGWRWCIPLQHRVGNGLVFSSKFLADEAAKEELVQFHRRQATDHAASAEIPDRQASPGVEQELCGARIVERLHRTTGIDQHSPDDGGRHAPAASVPVRWRSSGSDRSVQRSGAHRDGKDTRFRRASLPRDAT